jgi:gamma-glutamylcyclotransferase (GGCT)/AIG2-like uncharacterized protein YtfP
VTGLGPISPERALAIYGTLAPGGSNHHVVADIAGSWVEAALRGHRSTASWRGQPSYPAFRPDPAGPLVPALILVADELAGHWERLDAFEGPGYRRREIEVFDRSGSAGIGRAFVYETLPEAWDQV